MLEGAQSAPVGMNGSALVTEGGLYLFISKELLENRQNNEPYLTAKVSNETHQKISNLFL
jgi:hypothetical protein